MANVVQLAEDESVRALQRFITLRKNGLNTAQIVMKMGHKKYNLAEGEIISRSGDPDRFDKKTGNWIIWP